MPCQLGAFFPTRDMPADRLAIRDWAQAAEAIGFDFLEVSDHVLGADRAALPDFQGPYDVDDAFHETFVTLAYIAAVTERVGLSIGKHNKFNKLCIFMHQSLSCLHFV